MCLKAIVCIFNMVTLCSYGWCLSSRISLLGVALFPAHFSDISGQATTQYHWDKLVQDFRFRNYSPFVTGHIYSLQTNGITFTRFLSFLCLSVHTSPKYFNVSFSTSLFTSTYPLITSILSFPSSTSHVLNHLLLTMS